jgi:prepilin-type N-terminal cleavage/methylation domain-containing protein
MHGNRKCAGFTLVEIMIVVTIIAMLAVLAIPFYSRARNQTYKKACIANIRTLDGAKQQWALENYEAENAAPIPAELDMYMKGGTSKCRCPRDPSQTFATSYGINDVSTLPVCKVLPSSHQL